MNFKEIKELIEILDQSNLTEINIQEKDNIVSLKKKKKLKSLHHNIQLKLHLFINQVNQTQPHLLVKTMLLLLKNHIQMKTIIQ